MHLNTTVLSPDFFLLDLQDFFSDLESGGGGGGGWIQNKSSENDQLTAHFQSFFFSFF